MAVRTRLPWWSRSVLAAALVGVVGGMWWWGFDFGQIFGGFNRTQVEGQLTTLTADVDRYRAEVAQLRARNATLESELAMSKGSQEALSRQVTELSGDAAQAKEELAFLQRLVADANKGEALTIQRLTLEPDGDNTWRYSFIVVRGGNPKEEFAGRIVLRAALAGGDADGQAPAHAVEIPTDRPEQAPALTLKFKYYQRIEGQFQVPPGSRVMTLVVRAYESGQAAPRATRTLRLG